MSDNFGLKIGLEGEKEFKNALREINRDFKVLGSEMKLVTSQFDKQDKSIQAVTARNEVLNKEIDAQKNKIKTLESALKNAADSFGENDKRTKAWRTQLNYANADLNKMERELDESAKEAKDLEANLEKSGKAAEDAGSRFENMGGILKGMGVAMGSVALAAGAAAVKIGKEVVQQFGELEQNLGGSEAVFGKYADSIQKTGEEAYKNLGVSQSQYLATANKMGALFQGSGVDQEKSLELTEKAMQRAADMASVMGIDMQMALDSVAGAAKGNFTMMDNLGVAMNATSVEAYALAKGLDFTWASATQAEKAELAMQMFFENTEQYAGNFAKESTQTVTGSIGLLQAALGSFTAGLGNANADMTNLTANLVDAFQSVVENIVPIIENIVVALPPAMDGIILAIGELLPLLLTTVTDLFGQVLGTLLSLLPELIPAGVEAVMTIIQALIDNLPLLIEAAIMLVTALSEGIGLSLPELVPSMVEAVILIAETLINNLDLVLDAAFQIINGLAQGLLNSLPNLIEALPQIISTIILFITNNLPIIINMGVQITLQLAKGLIGAIPQLVAQLPQIIASIVGGFTKGIPSVKDVGKNISKGLWDGIHSMIGWLKGKVDNMVGGIVKGVKNVLGINSPSRVFAGIGANMSEGIGEGFTKSMKDVENQMNRTIPTSFNIDTNLGSNDLMGTSSTQNYFNIANMTVRKDSDIKSIARELYLLQRRNERGVALT
jgi:phage-related protein